MMLHWQVVVLSLIIEVIVASLFLIPGTPVMLKKQVISLTSNPLFQRGAKIYLAIVSVLCLGKTLLINNMTCTYLSLESLYENFTAKAPAVGSDHEEFHHYEADLLSNRVNSLLSGGTILMLLYVHY